MPDKDRERYNLSRLRECLPDIPEIEPLEPEPPDFLFQTSEGNLGIEVTSFFYPAELHQQPQQEIQSVRDYIVKRAEGIHAKAGGPALYVSVFFSYNYSLWKKDVPRVADQLAQSVLSAPVPTTFQPQAMALSFDLLPPEVIQVRVNASVDEADKLWHADSAGWVASIDPDHVQQTVNRKRRSGVASRQHCDRLWLVIVHDAFGKGAPADLSDEAKVHRYSHDFDRLLWLEPEVPRIFDLNRKIDAA